MKVNDKNSKNSKNSNSLLEPSPLNFINKDIDKDNKSLSSYFTKENKNYSNDNNYEKHDDEDNDNSKQVLNNINLKSKISHENSFIALNKKDDFSLVNNKELPLSKTFENKKNNFVEENNFNKTDPAKKKFEDTDDSDAEMPSTKKINNKSNIGSQRESNLSSNKDKGSNNSNTKKAKKINIDYGLLHKDKQKLLKDNTISTTKYTCLNFLPKSLLYQFRRAANIYFLIVSIMTCLEFSPKKPSSMIGTFSFVLIATMVKEFFEDYNRYKQDKASNERLTMKLEDNGWVEVRCQDLKAGEIVKVVKEEEFSADCIIIHSSNDNGYCYIDTKNLDGESNLKEKSSIEEFKSFTSYNNLYGGIKCDKTNENLNSFEGVLTIDTETANKNKGNTFISIRNMILKGCTLKNTQYAVGIVIYTGKDTKIMMNSKSPKIKVSKILKIMNVLLYSLFAFTILICSVLAGLSLSFKFKYYNEMEYVFNEHFDTLASQNDFLYYAIRGIIFFVAYSNIIPISLYVALEFVKIFQGFLIYYDNELFDENTEMAARCRATDLIEELGQVEFIFSDKTGTLTQNVMVLKKCYIDGELYGTSINRSPFNINSVVNNQQQQQQQENSDEKSDSSLSSNNNLPQNNKKRDQNFKRSSSFNKNSPKKSEEDNSNYKSTKQINPTKNYLSEISNTQPVNRAAKSNLNSVNSNYNSEIGKNANISAQNPNNHQKNSLKITEKDKFTINGDYSAYELMRNPSSSIKSKKKIDDYFTILSLCHAVFPEQEKEGINYQGSSPDDIALVKGADQFGYSFLSKQFSKLTINNEINNDKKIYDLLVEMPFDSDRKRMSVIVKDLETGNIKLLSKGADTIMMNRINWLKTVQNDNFDEEDNQSKDFEVLKKEEINFTKEILDTLCKEGLRCLILAQKEIPHEEFDAWFSKYSKAQEKGRDVSKYFDEIENDLLFSGVTAIEDKLQEGVGQTISSLMSCGIRVWVLTGDKEDTALEIGKSCKLIENDNQVMKITNSLEVENVISQMVKDFNLANNEFLGEDFFSRLQKENLDEIDKNTKRDLLSELPNNGKNLSLSRIKEHIYSSSHGIKNALIVDGSCLEKILNSNCLSSAFFFIASSCKAVICCRVSPKQKSKVVKIAKLHGEWITLSIGDGANDVPMIMEAHIGVGIQGKEGTQAVRSSDFSIGQFRFLEKLLLDYGRNGYIKISKFICYYFYKNILLAFTEFYFSIYNGFSGQIFFPDYLNTMYNAFFTSWPCLFTFFFEKTHSVEVNRKFPILYRAGPENIYFNMKVFWTYIAYSILHSAFCFFVPFFGLQGITTDNAEVTTYNLWFISVVSFSLVIHTSTYKLLVMSNFWTFVSILAVISSIVFYYVCLFVLSNDVFSLMFQPEIIGIPYHIALHRRAVLMILITPLLFIIPDSISKQVYFNFWPNPSEYLRIFDDLITEKILKEKPEEPTIDKVTQRLSSILIERKQTLYGRRMGSMINKGIRKSETLVDAMISNNNFKLSKLKSKENINNKNPRKSCLMTNFSNIGIIKDMRVMDSVSENDSLNYNINNNNSDDSVLSSYKRKESSNSNSNKNNLLHDNSNNNKELSSPFEIKPNNHETKKTPKTEDSPIKTTKQFSADNFQPNNYFNIINVNISTSNPSNIQTIEQQPKNSNKKEATENQASQSRCFIINNESGGGVFRFDFMGFDNKEFLQTAMLNPSNVQDMLLNDPNYENNSIIKKHNITKNNSDKSHNEEEDNDVLEDKDNVSHNNAIGVSSSLNANKTTAQPQKQQKERKRFSENIKNNLKAVQINIVKNSSKSDIQNIDEDEEIPSPNKIEKSLSLRSFNEEKEHEEQN